MRVEVVANQRPALGLREKFQDGIDLFRPIFFRPMFADVGLAPARQRFAKHEVL